jgi:acyl-CoA thioester hydrolase
MRCQGADLHLVSSFMSCIGTLAFPVQSDIRVRQGDLGRNGSVSTIGMARWLEDARLRVELPRFERLVRAGKVDPFQIVLVSQSVERLAPAHRTDTDIQVHTGVRRIGRSSFTFEHAVAVGSKRVGCGEATVLLLGAAGPLTLPDELVADLTALDLPDSSETVMARPDAERCRRDRYGYFAPLGARIGDVDSNQHVNFIVLATWYEEAVAAFTLAALEVGERGPVPDLSPSSYRINYVGEVTYPGDYEIGVVVRSFDARSVWFELGIFLGSTCLGVADAIGPRGELPVQSLVPSGSG